MSPERGRPFSDNPKDTMIRVRLDREYTKKLDACTSALQTTKSEVIRIGIDKVMAEIEKEQND